LLSISCKRSYPWAGLAAILCKT